MKYKFTFKKKEFEQFRHNPRILSTSFSSPKLTIINVFGVMFSPKRCFPEKS